MTYQLDFLPVGDDSKGGDAICFRYWADDIGQFVGVIDGGTKATGQMLVDHIREFYETETVDLVICTHPHVDHSAGLSFVLEQLDVNLLMMHLPWEHSDDILHLFHDGRITATSLSERIKQGLQGIHDLYELSLEHEIPIVEPFTGAETSSPFVTILGPTLPDYQALLPLFTSTPQAASLGVALKDTFKSAASWFKETWDADELVDPVEGTGPENNSSVVTLLYLDKKKMLLTGDAGVPALTAVCDICDRARITLGDFDFVQIPHHGSKRNVGPTILNRLVGPIVGDTQKRFTAMVSVPRSGEPKHPSRRVTNAFNRRGATVSKTCGQTVCHGAWQMRSGWSAVIPVPFYADVDETDD
ncbi:MAG: MBL fold metallo-hydrolase [Armatimonadetes bacterium]|nr:MBL fold metallo-hydrolase [Armatimonadota bacterium]